MRTNLRTDHGVKTTVWVCVGVFFLSETQLCVSFSMEKHKIPVHLGKPQLLHKDSLAQVEIREK